MHISKFIMVLISTLLTFPGTFSTNYIMISLYGRLPPPPPPHTHQKHAVSITQYGSIETAKSLPI